MVAFKTLWDNHPGKAAYPCDKTLFGNQCAIRMGVALRKSAVSVSDYRGKLCNEYTSLKSHQPGHFRSAQELANVFWRNPKRLGRKVRCEVLNGTVDRNMSRLKDVKGMVFIMNGWGNTDHIDVWDGATKHMKGVGANAGDYYGSAGTKLYVWDLSS